MEVLIASGQEQRRVAILESGSAFGEMALFGISKRTATIRALEACECRTVSIFSFRNILEQFPEEQRSFAEIAEKRLKQLEQLKQGMQG